MICPKIYISQDKFIISPSLNPELNANEIQNPYDKHPKVSLLVKSRENTNNSVKNETV